jgi:hypothetical protein
VCPAISRGSIRRPPIRAWRTRRANDGRIEKGNYGEIIMSVAITRTVFDVITDFLASEPTPEELIAYHLPDDLQARADELVEQNGEGQLTFDQQQELYDFMRADEMMALLKAKTKLRLRADKR